MSQQDVINLAIESYLQHMNNIGQRFQADRTLIPAHRQAPNVVGNFIVKCISVVTALHLQAGQTQRKNLKTYCNFCSFIFLAQ